MQTNQYDQAPQNDYQEKQMYYERYSTCKSSINMIFWSGLITVILSFATILLSAVPFLSGLFAFASLISFIISLVGIHSLGKVTPTAKKSFKFILGGFIAVVVLSVICAGILIAIGLSAFSNSFDDSFGIVIIVLLLFFIVAILAASIITLIGQYLAAKAITEVAASEMVSPPLPSLIAPFWIKTIGSFVVAFVVGFFGLALSGISSLDYFYYDNYSSGTSFAVSLFTALATVGVQVFYIVRLYKIKKYYDNVILQFYPADYGNTYNQQYPGLQNQQQYPGLQNQQQYPGLQNQQQYPPQQGYNQQQVQGQPYEQQVQGQTYTQQQPSVQQPSVQQAQSQPYAQQQPYEQQPYEQQPSVQQAQSQSYAQQPPYEEQPSVQQVQSQPYTQEQPQESFPAYEEAATSEATPLDEVNQGDAQHSPKE